MNKTAIKNFATNARRRLMEDVRQKAHFYGVMGQDKILPAVEIEGGIELQEAKGPRRIDNHQWMGNLYKQRQKLIQEITLKGYEQVIEEVSYTWFNRIIAIRFMEVNGYLPLKVRVLSSETQEKTEPDILTHIYDYSDELELDKQLVFQLKEDHKEDELFKYAFVHQCNKLGQILPRLFEKIEDHTELLLPDQLLSNGSVIRELVDTIEETDYQDQVEIIGWMYQYYISEKKDEVFDGLKNSKKVTKETLPAATQLFTPKWIVSYMVENTLGRLWQEAHPDEELKAQWQYYLQEAEQTSEVQAKLDALINKNLKPEEITFFDPAMGSGHILVYAFDVLFAIYKQLGYMERDISKLILENNLFGLDIDDRAGQLAYFALMMKGRSKSPTLFKQQVEPKVYAIQESVGISKEAIAFFVDPKATNLRSAAPLNQVQYLVDIFEDAKVFGSILTIADVDLDVIEGRLREVEAGVGIDLEGLQHKDEILSLLPLVRQARVMSRKYDVVTTNPPYMGNAKLNEKLKSYFTMHYSDVKSDFFSVFIERNYHYAKNNGHLGFMTPFVWMFISSYEKLREKMIAQKEITSLIQLEYSGFEEATVPICTFTLRNSSTGETGEYIKLSDFKGGENQPIKTLEAVKNREVDYRYTTSTQEFTKIPGGPIAYWASDETIQGFQRKNLYLMSVSASQNVTGNNDKFLRYHWEVDANKIGVGQKWLPYAKGGGYRKWYGNIIDVINWTTDARNCYRTGHASQIIPEEYWYKKGITWGLISSAIPSYRILPEGSTFDKGGSSIFITEPEMYNTILALLNSKVALHFLKCLNVTLNFQVRDIRNLPMLEKDNQEINALAIECINIARDDWDSFEISQNFNAHPFIQYQVDNSLLKIVFEKWQNITSSRFNNLISSEERINELLIEEFALSEYLESGVDPQSISVRQANGENDIKSFISYVVGCIFGRYSLDEYGLISTVGALDISRYTKYKPIPENALIINEQDYFNEDIVHKFIEFLETSFGKITLEENIRYIANLLKPDAVDSPRKIIRNYFVKDFYKDHVKTYKGKPIYWMMESGKQNGFKALFYLHRYEKDNIAMIRTEYLHELQKRYESHIELLKSGSEYSGKVKKQIDDIKKKLDELVAYDKVVAHLAHMQIELDLDDGVDVNYEKFQGVEIPQGESMKPLKANLLAKR